MARDLDRAGRPHRGGAVNTLIFAAKLLVTAACFWYAFRQIDFKQIWSALPLFDFRWGILACLLLMLQIPLVGLRWWNILAELGVRSAYITPVAMTGITAIGAFFAQVLPSVAGDGMRAWLAVRLGSDWRNAVTSVVIDRGMGVGLLIALGFMILLLPSGLTTLGGYRMVLLIAYAILLLTGLFVLLFGSSILVSLTRWRYARWLATLALDARRVVLSPSAPTIVGLACLVHALTIIAIWCLGRAQGLLLPITDAAVLFTVMVGVVLVPISISGWGLRELTIMSLLSYQGIAPERGLFFSVCFGLTFAISTLPGAVVWLCYSFALPRQRAEHGG